MKRKPNPSTTPDTRVRLQKFLSDAGVASRRHAEDLIRDGRVLVNDRVVDELPTFVDPAADQVVVNGALVRPQRHEYFIINKPRRVVTTNSDPAGRVRAVDLIPPLPARLFPVGRLDADSTGLLLLTNDGELAEKLTHPRYGVPKTYHAEVRGQVPADLPQRMRAGVFLAEGKAKASSVEILHSSYERSTLLITLREGRNRQVRRMLAKLGVPVRRLKRVQIGPLKLRDLPLGAARQLSSAEVRALKKAAAEATEHERQATQVRRERARKRSRAKEGKTSTRQAATETRPGRRLIS